MKESKCLIEQVEVLPGSPSKCGCVSSAGCVNSDWSRSGGPFIVLRRFHHLNESPQPVWECQKPSRHRMPAKAEKQKQSRGKSKGQVLRNARPRPPESSPTPQWPPLEPLRPALDLSLDVIAKDQLVVIRNFLTPKLCQKYVSFLSGQPLVTTPATPKAGDAVRVNDRVQFDDFAFAQQLWRSTSLEHLMTKSMEQGADDSLRQKTCVWGGEVCGLNPRIRVYRYSEGQFFGQHCEFASSFSIPWYLRRSIFLLLCRCSS